VTGPDVADTGSFSRFRCAEYPGVDTRLCLWSLLGLNRVGDRDRQTLDVLYFTVVDRVLKYQLSRATAIEVNHLLRIVQISGLWFVLAVRYPRRCSLAQTHAECERT